MRGYARINDAELKVNAANLSAVLYRLCKDKASKEVLLQIMRQLSDGTLRCLAITAALLSEEEKGMLVIEEVDNGIHPGRTKKIIHTISELAQKRNLDVLITTHNAVMLNALSKEDLLGVDIVYRDTSSGASKFISFVDIDRMPELLVNGKLGDVVTNGLILDYIKTPIANMDYSWLEVE